ncbi:hypothetical protein AVEN_105739-1 [Araneus ventricosus]|uniref:Uncharacterized protein n=1 Tax=Araneus ventricosus TaxID=182803 RepID=A0A4Y2QMG1_ARAVE|nr:hypothetical protein AVEN_105739-1 [Araneus ventricosus]
MVTSKLTLTCCKLVSSLYSCHDKFVASLRILQSKIAATLLCGNFADIVADCFSCTKTSLMLRTFSCVRTWSSGRYNNPMMAPLKFLQENRSFSNFKLVCRKSGFRLIVLNQPTFCPTQPQKVVLLGHLLYRPQLHDLEDTSVFAFPFLVADWRGSPVAAVRGRLLLQESK